MCVKNWLSVCSGFSSQSSCSSGGYIQSANWFPLNQCMWFDYYGYYVMFTACTPTTSSLSFDGNYATVTRTTYSDAACTLNPSTSSFGDDCSVPDATEPVLIESYLTQCSNTCSSSSPTITTDNDDSSGCCDNGKMDVIMSLSAAIFCILLVGLAIKLYEGMFRAKKQNYYDNDAAADKRHSLSRL